MNNNNLIVTLGCLFITTCGFGQLQVGVNTTSPDRTLEIEGTGTQYLRLQSTSWQFSEVGLELINGTTNVSANDWKITNDLGTFKVVGSSDAFESSKNEVLRINSSGFVGIGSTSPISPLHIVGTESATNTGDGYLLVGPKSGLNTVYSTSTILARNNGSPAPLYIQALSGDTEFGPGHVFMATGGGNIGVGGSAGQARLNIDHNEFQLYFLNYVSAPNDWYVGASNDSWFSGDDQLIFSTTSSSDDAILRLMDVTDNNGDVAPVMITSGNGTLLLDGNEIDSKSGALYFNHNSQEETYVNPSGGKVGVGTTNPTGVLHIKTSWHGLGLQQSNVTWNMAPVGNDLNFWKNFWGISMISWNGGGAWVALSDQRMKEDIREISPVMDKISQLPVYTYQFKNHKSDKRDIGIIAQELEPLFPEAVSKTGDLYGVMYDQLAVLAIKGVQEQQTQLETMNAQLEMILNR